jgi:hypothetical protein
VRLRRALIGSVLRLLLVYGALLALWPVVQSTYTTGFCKTAQFFLGSFGRDGRVHFRPRAEDRGERDLVMVLENRTAPGVFVPIRGSSRAGYIPMAVLLSLVAATPAPWRLRARAFVLGLFLVGVFIALRLSLLLLVAFSTNEAVATFAPGPFMQRVLVEAAGLAAGTWSSFVVPVFIWVVAMFSFGGWEVVRARVLGQRGSPSPDPSRTVPSPANRRGDTPARIGRKRMHNHEER